MNLSKRKVVSTIKDQVYEVIKESILNGELKPGQRIQELELASQLEVSRSPIRSAINELIGEGLLESSPNKSVRVRELTRKEIMDTFEFRLIIEKYAIEKVAGNLKDEIRASLLDFQEKFLQYREKGVLRDYVLLDSKFHEYLVYASDNAVILESLQKLSMLVMPFRIISLSSKSRFVESIEEHSGMIQAILRGDVDTAWEHCRTHLTLAKEEIVKHFEEVDAKESV